MAEKSFQLEVITPDRVVFSDADVVSVVLPGIEGYLGVLANHAPLMTELEIGRVDLRRADGTKDFMAVAGGFVEVFENKVTLLAQSAELKSEIDLERAEKSVQRAEERKSSHDPNIDNDRAVAALKRALNRLHVAQYHG
jgi:F-type H+-transporting ATPase subunit epsilon